CTGIGSQLQVDEELLVPDPDLSLKEGAISPRDIGKRTREYWQRLISGLAEEVGISMDTPFKDLPKAAKKALLHGKDYKVEVSYRNRWGRERRYTTGFEGVMDYVKRKHEEAESDQARDRFQSYMREVACPACGGARLNPTSLSVLVGGQSIAEVSAMPM